MNVFDKDGVRVQSKSQKLHKKTHDYNSYAKNVLEEIGQAKILHENRRTRSQFVREQLMRLIFSCGLFQQLFQC